MKKKEYSVKYFVVCKIFRMTMFNWWFSWLLRIINVYQCIPEIGGVDRTLKHENNFVRYHLHCFLLKTVTDYLN